MVDSEQVEEWADEVYESMGKETTWSIAQVSCPEEGCPPVETILTDLGVKKPKPGSGVYKIYKTIPEVTKEDVDRVLRAVGGEGEHGHGTGHGAAAHGEGDCCEGGHGAGHDGHGDGHGHGAAAGGHGS